MTAQRQRSFGRPAEQVAETGMGFLSINRVRGSANTEIIETP
jgi:hypothetical protein